MSFHIGKSECYQGVAMADNLFELSGVVSAIIFQERAAIYMDFSANKNRIDDLMELRGEEVTLIEIDPERNFFADFSGCLEDVAVFENQNTIELSTR